MIGSRSATFARTTGPFRSISPSARAQRSIRGLASWTSTTRALRTGTSTSRSSPPIFSSACSRASPGTSPLVVTSTCIIPPPSADRAARNRSSTGPSAYAVILRPLEGRSIRNPPPHWHGRLRGRHTILSIARGAGRGRRARPRSRAGVDGPETPRRELGRLSQKMPCEPDAKPTLSNRLNRTAFEPGSRADRGSAPVDIDDVPLYIVNRTQIYLDEDQTTRLDERAAAEGTSRSTVIRRAVDSYLSREEQDAATWRANWAKAIEGTAGVAPYLKEGAGYVEDIRREDAGRLSRLEARASSWIPASWSITCAPRLRPPSTSRVSTPSLPARRSVA